MISQEQKKKVNSPRLDFHQVKSGIFSNGLNRVRKEASVWSMHCLSGESCVPNSGTFDDLFMNKTFSNEVYNLLLCLFLLQVVCMFKIKPLFQSFSLSNLSLYF